MGDAVLSEHCPGCCPRVLVVENDVTVRSDHVEHLRRWGYEPFAAEGVGTQLLDDAAQKAAEHRCHLALVDMRLIDDYNRQDTSGLALVPQLQPTVAIIVSGYGDRAAVRDALKAKQAFDFVGKEEGPGRLRQAIRDALRQHCNCPMPIQWYPGYEPPDIVQKLLPGVANVPIDEPACIISRLYANQSIAQIELRPITAYYGAIIDRPARERSVVMVARAQGVDQHWRQTEIVKLTQKEPIEDEVSNYHRYVAPHLSPHRTARIEDRANAVTLWDLGGLRYTNIATEQRKPFRQWYAQATTEQVIHAITDLFDETLQPWYRLGSPQQVDTVYDYYVNTFPKLEQRLAADAAQSRELHIPGLAIALPNPVSWIRTRSRQSRFLSYWEAYTHGDLHGGNIFVDQFGRTAVIDYERSGPGYFLRDIVELEVDIRLRILTVTRGELSLAYELDTLLLIPEHPDQLPQWRDIPAAKPETQANLRKAFEVIVALRHLARRVTHFERMDEYYWALLMETLFSVLRDYAKWSDQTEANLARERAFLSASLICDRLEQWGKSWPAPPRHSDDTKQYPPTPSGEKAHFFPHGYALLIGVGHIPHAPHWSLPVTVQDAQQLKVALQDPELCAYRAEHMRMLHDNTASSEEIRDGLRWLATQTLWNKEATVVVYFSGHGWLHHDGRYALIPADVQPNSLANSVFWADEFSTALRQINARRLLVLIDACHAEGMARAKGDELHLPAVFSKAPPPDNVIADLFRGEGRVVISSSRGNQRSYVRCDGTLSIFTHHLIEALRGASNRPGDTLVHISNLVNHLGKKVAESAQNDWGADQTPWIEQAAEDFPVALLLGGKGLDAAPPAVA